MRLAPLKRLAAAQARVAAIRAERLPPTALAA